MYSDYPSDWDFAPIAEFADRLPKVETHLHLEGALPYRMLQELEPERFPKTPSFWKEDFRHESFEAFDRTLLDHATAWFTPVERYREAAKAVFEELKTQNVRYVETSFHLGILEFLRDATGPEIISAFKSAIPEGMEVRIFAGITRDLYQSEMREIIDDLHRWEELDGMDLHGRETLPMEDWKREVWQRNRDAGKVTKAHAGEFGGAENVRYVIEELGVKRVQHGVRAVEDPAVLELAREK